MSNLPSPASDDDDQSTGLSSTPTPTPFSHLHRSLSHSSTTPSVSYSQGQPWSPSETPQHHNQGTSYFNAPSHSPTATRHPPPPPILMRSSSAHSVRRGPRSTSVSSTARAFRDEQALSEADEYDDDSDGEGDGGERVDRHGKRSVAASIVDGPDEDGDDGEREEEDPITLKERQSLINVEHPFGLPIWKPALYKKSRSVTRYADEALHSVPSAQAARHLLPGNLFWVVFFGWWLSLVCFVISALLYVVPQGGKRYSSLVFGLGWYIAWPFGKYVEGVADDIEGEEHEDEQEGDHERSGSGSGAGSDTHTVRGESQDDSFATVRGAPANTDPSSHHTQTLSWNSNPSNERSALLHSVLRTPLPAKSYGALSAASSSSSIGLAKQTTSSDILGKVCFWLAFVCIIAPLMLIVCLICWGLVLTIPMAKLNWALIKHIFEQPDTIRFCAAPLAVVVDTRPEDEGGDSAEAGASASAAAATMESGSATPRFSVKHPRLTPGQAAPSGSPCTAVLLCTYRAVGIKYYKYTVGGVNIMFVNLMFVVFFVIFDWAVFLTWVEELEEEGRPVPRFLSFIASQGLIFVLSLLSVIPLSYFIGMAVASISAQSSIGMGAVINATFGSIIEILLYSIALDRGKGRLVEGSIVGSLLAGVLLMPGLSMISSAFRRKEQKFNAKSAGVTSMMLIMAIIGALTPTLFYQTYGNFQLVCTGCPPNAGPGNTNKPWVCEQCYYQHPDPVNDPFYQSTVKSLMFFCAAILLFSYLVGLWFSLRTHASQIWQNPQQLLNPMDLPVHHPHGASSSQNPNARQSLYHKIIPPSLGRTLSHRASHLSLGGFGGLRPQTPMTPRDGSLSHQQQQSSQAGHAHANPSPNPHSRQPGSPTMQRRVSYAPSAAYPTTSASSTAPPHPGFTPLMESVDHAVKNTGLQSLQLPEQMTTDDFTRAVAVATVSALRHQQTNQSPARMRMSVAGGVPGAEADAGGHGGHDAPSWSRFTSASVLLACTALYAVIAEILVDVIDVILGDSGLDEKVLGVTLLALVPNTTEFMNAISFALNGNIALSMEIGSAYALQVCLLQIPAMVAFSAWWFPERLGEVAHTFSLIFPRWDVITIILSMFLLTYTYIEAKSNYHRGSILVLSYLVLIAGFFYAPRAEEIHPDITLGVMDSSMVQEFSSLTAWEYARWYLTAW